MYSERPGKGKLILGATALSAGILLWQHEVYHNRLEDFRRAREDYFEADNVDELADLRAKMDRQRRLADRSYDRRNIALYTTGGLYALAFIDAVFLFPDKSAGSFALTEPFGPGGPRFAGGATGAGGVGLSLRFGGEGGIGR